MLAKSITEIVPFFPECFLFGINTRETQTHGAAVLSLGSRAWGWFMPSGSRSHLGRCHNAAQFSVALASLQPLGSALQGLETTLPHFTSLSSPCEGEAEPAYEQLCSMQKHFLERDSA